MQRRTALTLPALAALAALGGSACREPDCLEGGACDETAPCAELEHTCATVPPEQQFLVVDVLETGDIVLQNSRLKAVFDALGQPHDLAPTGGNLISLDGGYLPPANVNLIYQIAGILPEDAFAYDSYEVLQQQPDMVGVIFRGTLDGRPDVEVATRYELHRCDHGLVVRSELRNRTPDTQVFIVADAAHWGKRRILPFTPVAGEGWLQPELDLIELESSWESFPYVAAQEPGTRTTYGWVRCDDPMLEGVNDPEISALGTARSLVRPGESLMFERYLVAVEYVDDRTPDPVDVLRDARAQLHGEDTRVRTVRGRIVSRGLTGPGYPGPVSIVVGERVGDAVMPVTPLVPALDGTFEVSVSDASLAVEVWAFGRRVVALDGPPGPIDFDLGDVELPPAALVRPRVLDATGELRSLVVFQPADAAERERLRGSFHGRHGECAPWLGPPHGASPACNRFLTRAGQLAVWVPPGRYLVYATAGPDRTLARRELIAEPGASYDLDFVLESIDLRPPGWLWADLHVHGRASFDSAIPDPDRFMSFEAAGVDVVAATDHDYITDYSDVQGVDEPLVVMGGLEITQLIPWMDVPGDDFPRVIGHFNFWPLTPDPAAPRGGAPWDERIEPGELFDIMAPLVGDDGMMMLNHPWDDTQFGRDLGYLRAINFDPLLLIPEEDDGSAQGMLVRRPAGGHRNVDFDVIEVMNGASAVNLVRTRPLWFSLLSQGYVKAGAANSDSHGLTDAQIGYARTLVDADTTPDAFDPALFNQAVRDGRSAGGNGVVVLVTVGRVDRTRPSLTPYVPAEGDWIDIEVRAPPWIPVTEVRLTTSAGTVVVAEGGALMQPTDPFGTQGVVRIQWARPLTDIIPGRGDDWIVVEAGMPLPPAADLDDDGVPDTGDNDGDGDVDDDDIEPGEDSGPHDPPPDPTDPADPRFVCTQVIPGLWPAGFANPLLIDWDGDGWTPPGIR